MTNEIQKKIDERIKQKDARYNKVELSIEHRWAVNCALQILSPCLYANPEDKFKAVKEWTDKFIEWDREYMMDNLPEEQLEDERPL